MEAAVDHQETEELLRERLKLSEAYLIEDERNRLSEHLRDYVPEAWNTLEPGRKFVGNWHIDYICEYLEAVSNGEITRLLINIPFRCMKSLLVSVFWPTWTWTRTPHHQFLTLSHAEKLAVRDALKSRRLMRSPWYQRRWGHKFEFTGDQNEKSRYENNMNGHRIALGIKAGVTGEGGDTIIIDDPHDAEKAQSDVERESVIDNYDHKIVTRLNDQVTGNMVLIMQRLHQKDLAGHVMAEEGDWEELILPMEYEPKRYVSVLGLDDPRTEPGELLEPERFPRRVVDKLKRQLGSYAASGQLQQRPSPSEGGILKKTWWRKWPQGKPWPRCNYILQSYDTAYSADDFKGSARSARTTWGVFKDEIVGLAEREFGPERIPGEMQVSGEGYGILLLEAWADHVEYPELRREGLKSYREWKPDAVLIEKKASGQSLIQDMRKAGIPVLTYQPDRDKVSRAYSVQAMLEGGLIFYPDRKWADEVREECMIAGTQIITVDGIKNIEDIRIGDLVMTHKGRFRSVLALSEREADNLVCIEGKTLSPITMTADHPVYAAWVDRQRNVKSLDWIAAGDTTARVYRDVTRDETVFSEPTSHAHHAMTLPVPVSEQQIQTLDLRQFIRMPKGKDMELYVTESEVFSSHSRIWPFKWEQRLDYKFGRLIGLYLAEGWANRQQATWAFNATTEQHLVEFVETMVRERFGNVCIYIRTQKNCTSITVRLPLLEGFFDDFGHGASEKKLPSWAWDAPEECQQGILDGWAEGDGHQARGQMTVVTVSISLAWHMRLLAAGLGISVNVNIGRQAGPMEIQGRKVNCKTRFAVVWQTAPKFKGSGMWTRTEIAYSIMRSRPVDGEQTVYNLHVYEDNSYVTTGGAVHNCGMFPFGEFDDLVDTVTQAWIRLRSLHRVEHPDDVEDKEDATPKDDQQEPAYG